MTDLPLETFLNVGVGLCLAAACGLRVFLPLAGLSLAATYGHLPLAAPFEFLATRPACIVLGTATVAEIAAYYIPWLDHALDALATPTAIVAGILATGALTGELPPILRWVVALVGGGGAAGLIQGATVLLRLKSTALTGGIGNSAVATAELGGSIALVGLALFLPLLGLLLAGMLVVAVGRRLGRVVFGRKAAKAAAIRV